MFRNVSVAEFEVNGLKAQFIIDSAMPVESVQAILNKLIHFCVERQKEAENEIAQRIKDEEAAKKPELEQEEAKASKEEIKSSVKKAKEKSEQTKE